MGQDIRAGWALGGVIFAATMMLVIGAFQMFLGIAAIAQDSLFVITDGYTYAVDTQIWGWGHLILGALILLAGLYLYRGSMWARAIGIALAVLSAVANFFLIPYYPIWSLLIIALDAWVIWALATADRHVIRADEATMGAGTGGGMGGGMGGGSHRAGGQRWPVTNPSRYGDTEAARRAGDVKPPSGERSEGMPSGAQKGQPGSTQRRPEDQG